MLLRSFFSGRRLLRGVLAIEPIAVASSRPSPIGMRVTPCGRIPLSVAITAGVFALMHMQYDPAVMLLILPMGVVLGYARARSGSIWVPILLHTLNNLVTVLFP